MKSVRGSATVNTMLLKLHIKLQDLANREEAQDLVEYVLVTSLIGFSWVAGLKSAAAAINTAFLGISTTLSSYTS
jgi:Flp pilus assembly pilin Flp